MTERRPADHAVRTQALDPADSFIVQAPAGSGKTDLLIKRYLVLLARVERPEEILAITFTRKAAAEMRQRVLEALRRADEPAGSDHEAELRALARAARERDRACDWQLERHPARLRIQTIDSFNAELTRQLPLLAKFGSQPQITEAAGELYETAVRQTLELLEVGGARGQDREGLWSGAIAALLRHLDNDWHKAHGLIRAMLPKREQWLAQITASHDRAYAEQALANEIAHQLAQLRAATPASLEQELPALAAYAAEHVEDNSAIAACRNRRALPAPNVEGLPQWRGIAELLLTANGDWRRKPNKNQGFPATAKGEKARIEDLLQGLADHDNFRRRLQFVRQLPDPGYADVQWQLMQALTELLPLAVAQLKLVFAARGQVDFAEMAERALQALGSAEAPTDLGLRLDYRIRHILVDEFQDTSAIQYELLKLLTAGWQPGDGRSLFLVGDPMQSIYRFREAEVGLFLDTWQHGLGDLPLTPLALTVNFRSCQGIVDWVNESFAGVLPARPDIASGAVPYAPAAAWHPAGAQRAVSVHPQFDKDEAVEAQRVLAILREGAAAGGETTAVLVQSRNHLAALVPLLRELGLRYQAVEIERLGSQPAVLDLLALTRALVHPADRIAWLSLLRAPWCGLTRRDLHALAADRPDATGPELVDAEAAGLSEDGRRRLARVAAVLDTALAERRRGSLRDLVESVWLALGGPCCAGAGAALDDAAAYLELLGRVEQGGDLDRAGRLLEELEQLFAPPDPEAGEALQIMTIHKAKGLQFDRVILPGLGRPPRRDDPQLLLWQTRRREHGSDLLIAPLTAAGADRDPVYQFLQALDRERGEYERGRLLYVACTRARQELHLLGHVNVKTDAAGHPELKPPPAGSALALLWPQVAGEFERALAARPTDTTTAGDEGSAAESRLRRLPIDWVMPALPAAPVAPPALAAAADTPPVEFSWAGETARVVGVIVHRLLQRIARDGIEVWSPQRLGQLQPMIRSLFRQHGLPQAHHEAAAAQVREAVAAMLADERGRWILDARHAEAAAELALSRIAAGRLETVVLDRTFVDEAGRRWIIDYKTGSHAGGDVEEFLDREQERYRVQLERYAEFLRPHEPRPIRLGLYFPLLGGWREWPA